MIASHVLNKSSSLISDETGILKRVATLPIQHGDPKLIVFGVIPSDTTPLGATKFPGRGSGCAYSWQNAMLTTLGEISERYAPVFYNKDELIHCSYSELPIDKKIPLSEYALYHENQYQSYEDKGLNIKRLTPELKLHWDLCTDLVDGQSVHVPATFIYMPFYEDPFYLMFNTSTGLAAHSNFYKAVLGGLYECMERDSFVQTWMHHLDVPKIKITKEMQEYIDTYYPSNYQYHLLDITLDLEKPSVFGFCIGKSDYGDFITVGSSTRGTYAEAVKKVIMECGQAVSYLRHTLGINPGWNKKRNELVQFEDHSLYYTVYQEEQKVFQDWIEKTPTKEINFSEERNNSDIQEIQSILKIMKAKDYNVLLRDVTTVDVNQAGFYSIKIYIPQLIQMAGGYNYYFNGGKRLYEVPPSLGYPKKNFDELTSYPFPFP
ncbi:YcaO-like family protein [Maribacter sp. IgM3_T14_3]|uniref:YcaO-like family protein n=1 Tax=Maribacter sp. IgM3_T14_3 TaxID=3415140 RepID=UPI003C6EFD31